MYTDHQLSCISSRAGYHPDVILFDITHGIRLSAVPHRTVDRNGHEVVFVDELHATSYASHIFRPNVRGQSVLKPGVDLPAHMLTISAIAHSAADDPTPEQLRQLAHRIGSWMRYYDIPASRVITHKDIRSDQAFVERWRTKILKQIAQDDVSAFTRIQKQTIVQATKKEANAQKEQSQTIRKHTTEDQALPQLHIYRHPMAPTLYIKMDHHLFPIDMTYAALFSTYDVEVIVLDRKELETLHISPFSVTAAQLEQLEQKREEEQEKQQAY
jgi:hypothetical protein